MALCTAVPLSLGEKAPAEELESRTRRPWHGRRRLSLAAFDILFVLYAGQFDHDVSGCGLLLVHSLWSVLSSMSLGLHFCPQIGKVFTHFFFK